MSGAPHVDMKFTQFALNERTAGQLQKLEDLEIWPKPIDAVDGS
jgi:hypothetical protein